MASVIGSSSHRRWGAAAGRGALRARLTTTLVATVALIAFAVVPAGASANIDITPNNEGCW